MVKWKPFVGGRYFNLELEWFHDASSTRLTFLCTSPSSSNELFWFPGLRILIPWGGTVRNGALHPWRPPVRKPCAPSPHWASASWPFDRAVGRTSRFKKATGRSSKFIKLANNMDQCEEAQSMAHVFTVYWLNLEEQFHCGFADYGMMEWQSHESFRCWCWFYLKTTNNLKEHELDKFDKNIDTETEYCIYRQHLGLEMWPSQWGSLRGTEAETADTVRLAVPSRSLLVLKGASSGLDTNDTMTRMEDDERR